LNKNTSAATEEENRKRRRRRGRRRGNALRNSSTRNIWKEQPILGNSLKMINAVVKKDAGSNFGFNDGNRR